MEAVFYILFKVFVWILIGVFSAIIEESRTRRRRQIRTPILSKSKRVQKFEQFIYQGINPHNKFRNHPVPTMEYEIEKVYKALSELIHVDLGFVEAYMRKIVPYDKLFSEQERKLTNGSDKAFFIALYYWMKKKETYDINAWEVAPNKTLKENQLALLNVLFEKYEVPATFKNIWWNWKVNSDHTFFNAVAGKKNVKSLDSAMFDLYFYLCDGYSIRKYPSLGFTPSKKETQLWIETPALIEGSLTKSFWRACFLTQGGNEKYSNFIFNIDLDVNHLVFWRQFLKIIARDNYNGQYPHADLIDLVDLINLIKFGELKEYMVDAHMAKYKGIAPNFSLKGMTIKSLKRVIFEMVGQTYELPAGFKPTYTYTAPNGSLYQIRHLDNRLAMKKEATQMGHCIDSWEYHVSAVKGEAHYWSLRLMDQLPEGEPVVTMELEEREIVEFQAYDNTEPDKTIMSILQKWATENKVKLGYYCTV